MHLQHYNSEKKKCDTHVQCNDDENHQDVEPEQGPVLGQAVGDEAVVHAVQEVAVEADVHDHQHGLLGAVPDGVELVPGPGDLQARGDPDDNDADGEGQDHEEHAPLQPPDLGRVVHQKRDPVDDNLHQKLDL